jgi:hypothetical protein
VSPSSDDLDYDSGCGGDGGHGDDNDDDGDDGNDDDIQQCVRKQKRISVILACMKAQFMNSKRQAECTHCSPLMMSRFEFSLKHNVFNTAMSLSSGLTFTHIFM